MTQVLLTLGLATGYAVFRLGARLIHRGAAEGHRYIRNRKEG